MLQEARQKDALTKKPEPKVKEKAKESKSLASRSQRAATKEATSKPAQSIGLKGNLEKEAPTEVAPRKYYAGQKSKEIKEVVIKGGNEVVERTGDAVNRSVVVPSMTIESYKEKKLKTPVKARDDILNKEDLQVSTQRENQAKEARISRAQKILQANFLKAAQMDDPVKREQAMSRLFALQS